MVNRVDNPLVSIVMNCYNGDQFLKEAIDSIYNQTYENWEVIFWDNQSTDNSSRIVKSYGEKIRYFYADEHTSLGMGRKNAVNRCKGKFIAFLDCDDSWAPNKLELQINKMQYSDYSVCYTGCTEIDENNNKIVEVIPVTNDGIMFDSLLCQYDFPMASIFVRKSSLDEFNLNFDENIYGSEEYCLFMQLAAKSKFCVIKTSLVVMRIREKSLTTEQASRAGAERRYTLDKIKANNHSIELDYPDAMKEAYARANYYDAKYFMSINKQREARKMMKKNIGVSYIYVVLYFILYLPKSFWYFINSDFIKKKSIF